MRLRTTARRSRTALALTGLGGVLLATGVAGLGPTAANSSSHREAPLIAGLPQYDTTDLYAFRSPEAPEHRHPDRQLDAVRGAGRRSELLRFATDARYNIKIDNNADAKPDVTFRWTFKDHYVSGDTFLVRHRSGHVPEGQEPELLPDLQARCGSHERQDQGPRQEPPRRAVEHRRGVDARLRRAARGRRRRRAGRRVQSFAGQAEDPFFLDLRVFDLLYGGDFSEAGDDTLAGFNVNSVALQVPAAVGSPRSGNAKKNPIIGIWSTTQNEVASTASTARSPAWATRWSTRSSSRSSTRTRSTPRPRGTRGSSSTSPSPSCPSSIEAVYGIDAPEDAAQRPGVGVPHGRRRASTAQGQGHAERAAAPQHVDPGHRRRRTGSA